ncbi:MAG: acetylglutamate kinase [Ruminococcaceae bacterium]|nr:acetylglutamate kinase [Oscillospiraceae bacterium]
MNDMELLIKKAGILIEALPYIQRFAGKTIVVKYGGNAMINDELKNSVMEDLTLLKYIGLNPILVHGGGPDISEALKTFNIESEFINGLRVTDEETVKVAQMVLVGKTNKEIVSLLNQKGGNALGICGIDGNLIKCKKLYTEVDGKKTDIGYVGDIIEINNKVLEYIIKDEFIPVVAPIGVGENGESYNINADTVAGALAASLNAEKLIMLTDVEGIKTGADGELLYYTNKQEILDLIDKDVITGGMIPKVLGCLEALDKGVNSVHIIDGRVPHCLLLEIFTKSGIGTMIEK